LNGYRFMKQDPENLMRLVQGLIAKRGRKTVINLLRNYRWVTNHHQRTMLTYGIEYPDDLVKGLNQKRGGSNV